MDTTEEHAGKSQRGTILIVDDNLANLEVMAEYLTKAGSQVMTARTGETGLALVQRDHPDLILLDVILPGIDGFETCRRLKADKTTREIPVIFMTVVDRTEDKVKGLAVGGVDYITKPFQAEEVLARCTTHLTLYQLQQDLRDLNRTLEDRVTARTAELIKVNRAYRTLSSCNQAMLHAAGEGELLDEICRIIQQDYGYRLVWIGFAEPNDAKTVRPVARAGYEEGYLELAKITWADNERGQGPEGTAVRSGQRCIIKDIQTDPQFAPWREEAIRRGYASCIVLPLRSDDRVFGVLSIYSTGPDAFHVEEVDLLMELASDLAFGITSLRERAERKRAEEALRESEKQFRLLAENSTDMISRHTPDGVYSYVSPACRTLLGYEPEDLIGHSAYEFFHPEDMAAVKQSHTTIIDRPMVSTVDYRIRRKDGQYIWFETTSKTVRDSQSEAVLEIQAASRDITERKRAERKTIELAAIVQSSEDAIIGKTLDGIITSWNRGAERIYGYTESEMIGSSVRILALPDQPDEVLQILEKIRLGEPIEHYETVRCRKDGQHIQVSISVSPIRDPEGRIVAASTIAHDITERNRVQSILQARLRLLEFARSHSLDELLTATLDEIEALTGSTIGFYHFVEPDQKTLALQNWSTNTLKHMCTAEGKGSHYDIAQAGVWVDCVHERRSIIHNDYASLPHRKGLPEGHAPVIREAVVPIFRGNLIKAILGVGNKPTDYHENDIQIVSQLGDLSWDIAERKRAEEELKEQYSTLRSIIDSTDALIFSVDRQYRYTSFNRGHAAAMNALYGVAIEIGHSLLDYLTVVEDREAARHNLDRALAGEQLVEEAYSGEEPRSRRYFRVSHGPIKAETGEIIGVAMLAQDVTERRRAEEQLRKLSRAVEQNPASIIITDTTGAIEYVNPKFTQLTGYTLEEIFGKNPRILKSGKTPPEEYARLWHTITAGGEWRGELRNKKKNGELYWESASISPILNDAGDITHFVAVKEDITERKRAEQAIRESQQWLSLLVAQSLLAVIECNTDFEIVSWNPAAEEFFGYTREEVLGRPAINLIVPETMRPQVNQLLQTLLTGGGGNHHVNENRTKDGRTILCEWYNSALVSADGQVIGVASIGANITERRQMEEARHERDRLQVTLEKEREISAIKNNMMRTVSHEFRTPLAVISSAIFLLLRYYERLTNDQRQKQLETIGEQVHKLDQMVEEIVSAVHGVFSDFAFHPLPTDLELLGQLAVTELQSTIGAKHQMTFEGEGQLQNVLIDERLVKRILINLLSNAIKYSPEGRLIRLRIAEEAETIIIQVIDQGIGISAEDQKRLFEPFFRASNVETVSGIGLGLSIVRDCVTLHQGAITTESELNKGTTFTVNLPMQPSLPDK